MNKFDVENKIVNGLTEERRNRLSAINNNATAMGLTFRLVDEHLVANTPETDAKIELLESMLEEFKIIRKNYNSKLEELSISIFSSK